MSEGALCLYNQKGYCNFKDKCRRTHENKTCPEDTNCRQKECPYRHPKVWRNFSKKKLCWFGEECAYKHKVEINISQHEAETAMKHSQEINAMQEEISHLKVIINYMQNQINTLGQDLEMSQKTNIK